LLGMFAVLGVWCMLHYKLTEQRHAEIQQILLERKQAEGARQA